jgi:hypothetical protein
MGQAHRAGRSRRRPPTARSSRPGRYQMVAPPRMPGERSRARPPGSVGGVVARIPLASFAISVSSYPNVSPRR